MEYKLSVSKFNHDDIVNILASTVAGSMTVGVRYDKELWDSLTEEQKTPDACIEDICADLLLAGKYIYLFDVYYEESEEDQSSIRTGEVVTEDFGWNGIHNVMRYKITLQDFLDAANTPGGSEIIQDFIREEDDLESSECFLQMVMFGDIVYG